MSPTPEVPLPASSQTLIPLARLKHKVEPPCWDEKLGGYLIHALVSPNSESGVEMWNCWCKDLEGIQPGIGRTKQEAIDGMKEHIRLYLTTLIGGREGTKIPWTSLVAMRVFGSLPVLVLVKGAPGPSGKIEEETKQDSEVQMSGKTDNETHDSGQKEQLAEKPAKKRRGKNAG